MGTTAHYGYPYPEGSDPPAGHTQIKALADAVDAAMLTSTRGTQSGETLVTFSNAAVAQKDVTFAHPYSSPPAVTANASSDGYRNVGVDNVTANGFRVSVRTIDNQPVSSQTGLNWIAHGTAA